MDWKGNALGFLKKFGEGIGNFIFGNPLDEDGNVKPLNPGYQGPGFQGLPDHQKEKEYQLLREQGPQASAIPFLNDFLTAQNQGPSSPIKYYPDANSGSGGFLFNSGAGRIGDVRMKA